MTLTTQQPTQQEMAILSPALVALKKYAAEATLWGKPEIRVEAAAVTAIFALIDAQNKRIAELLEDNKELHI